MRDPNWLVGQFEENRGYLRGVAYRMLGSLSEADDAVQESWLRLSRSDADSLENLRAWLTTVVARICLDMLRSRKSRGEETLEATTPAPSSHSKHVTDPETEAMLADSVGYATLVVLDRLNPAERIAFVLHDIFDIPFEEIARIAGRSPDSARQLASRARRRIRGASTVPNKDLPKQRMVAEKFLAALQTGDVATLLEVLDPSFSAQADATAAPQGLPANLGNMRAWAELAIKSARGARLARLAEIEGSVGLIVAPRGRLFRVLRLTYSNDRIAALEIIADPERMRSIEIHDLAS